MIVGHNNQVEKIQRREEDWVDWSELQDKVKEVINGLYKDTSAILSGYEFFFNSLSNVKKVVVYGHSLADIDRPYFEKIKESIALDSEWEFSFHDDDECNKIKNFAKKLGIKFKMFKM